MTGLTIGRAFIGSLEEKNHLFDGTTYEGEIAVKLERSWNWKLEIMFKFSNEHT